MVPLTVTVVPEDPVLGLKLLIVGADGAPTTNAELLTAVPAEVVTLIAARAAIRADRL